MTVEHYYSENPSCKKKTFYIKEKVFGVDLDLVTATGIYSPLQLDKGSLAHIKFLKIKKGYKVLDLGCAYGTMSILIGKLFPKTEIYMTDINKRAVGCARENLKRNKVKAKLFQGDGFKSIPDKDFDVIVFNPPIHAGLYLCYRLIAESFEHLKKGGTLQIVLRPKIGGERLVKKIKTVFGNVEKLGKEGIFSCYIATKQEV